MLVVQETACLSVEDRRAVDGELGGRLASLGPARARASAWAAACRLDPASAVRRCRKAVAERRVSLRPAPDTMTYLSALLPVRDGVAVYAALDAAAAAARAIGEPRGRGQVMADTLVDRIRSTSAGGGADFGAGTTSAPGAAAVEVHLVITDDTLLRAGTTPALLTSDLSGSNTAADVIPAPMARALVRDAATAWVRRLYTHPTTGQLVAMESTRRVFDGNLRRMLLLRDQTCRPPGAGHPSGTATTSTPTRPVDRPPWPTGKGCANGAITPNPFPVGEPPPFPEMACARAAHEVSIRTAASTP